MKEIVIHCPTELLAKLLLKSFDKKGLKWSNEESYLKKSYWDDYEQDTCYNPDKGAYCSLKFYKSYGYQIISAEVFLSLHLKYLL